MSILKTGFIAASLCLAASFAHAGTGTPDAGPDVLEQRCQSALAQRAATHDEGLDQFQGHPVQPRSDGKQVRPLSRLLTAKDRRA